MMLGRKHDETDDGSQAVRLERVPLVLLSQLDEAASFAGDGANEPQTAGDHRWSLAIQYIRSAADKIRLYEQRLRASSERIETLSADAERQREQSNATIAEMQATIESLSAENCDALDHLSRSQMRCVAMKLQLLDFGREAKLAEQSIRSTTTYIKELEARLQDR